MSDKLTSEMIATTYIDQVGVSDKNATRKPGRVVAALAEPPPRTRGFLSLTLYRSPVRGICLSDKFLGGLKTMKSDPKMRAKIKAMTEEQRRKLLRKQFLEHVVSLGEDGFPAEEICCGGIAALLETYAGLVGTTAMIDWMRRLADTVEEPGQTPPPRIN